MRIKNLLIGILAVIVSVAIIAAVLVSVLLFHFKHVVEMVVGRTLGANVEIGRIYLNLKNNVLYLTDFELSNPKGFTKDERMAYLPLIKGTYDPRSLIVNKKLHFLTLDIYVRALVVAKNEKGKLNVEQLAIFKEKPEELPVQTARLVLSADHVVYKYFTKGRLHIEEFDVNIKNQEYEGFPSLEDVTAKAISVILGRTTIKGFTLLGTAVLFGSVGGWSVIIPAEAVVVMADKGSYSAVINANYDDVYTAALEAAHELGKDINEYKKEGIIKGYMNNANVTIRISQAQGNKTAISVSAKGLFLSRLNIAGGVLYEIVHRLIVDKKTSLDDKLVEKFT